ncbi:MAG: SIMPL domain-containing protein [Solirubrobacteraceae bacterium]
MRRTPVTRLAAAVLLGLMLAPPTAQAEAAAPSPSTISVTGIGAVLIAPDVADISIAVRSGAFSATRARSQANVRTRRVLAAIVMLGVDRGAIQTSGITLERTSTIARRGHPARAFYTASNSLSVHLTRLALVGPVIDAATAAGADSIDGPSYAFANPSQGRGLATQAALADARARADAAAAATGYHVTGVQSIDIDPQAADAGPQPLASAPAAANGKATATTPVSPGRLEVDSTVRVVYSMAPN